MPDTPFRLSLVIPCYQELHRLEKCVAGIEAALALVPGKHEVLLVDDGSTDGTADFAESLLRAIPNAQVVRERHRGKGAAIRAGVAASQGEVVFIADADWSMPPGQILRFVPLEDGPQGLLIASRERPDSQRHGEPLSRHLLGRVFNTLVRHTLLPGIQDSQCGFKCLPGDLARSIFCDMQTEGWAFDVELIKRVQKSGHTVTEVGIDWNYDPDSRLKPTRDAVKMAWEVLKVWRQVR